jgi:hypothetical protein
MVVIFDDHHIVLNITLLSAATVATLLVVFTLRDVSAGFESQMTATLAYLFLVGVE